MASGFGGIRERVLKKKLRCSATVERWEVGQNGGRGRLPPGTHLDARHRRAGAAGPRCFEADDLAPDGGDLGRSLVSRPAERSRDGGGTRAQPQRDVSFNDGSVGFFNSSSE